MIKLILRPVFHITLPFGQVSIPGCDGTCSVLQLQGLWCCSATTPWRINSMSTPPHFYIWGTHNFSSRSQYISFQMLLIFTGQSYYVCFCWFGCVSQEVLESMNHVLLFLKYLPAIILPDMEKNLGKCRLNVQRWNKYIFIIESEYNLMKQFLVVLRLSLSNTS